MRKSEGHIPLYEVSLWPPILDGTITTVVMSIEGLGLRRKITLCHTQTPANGEERVWVEEGMIRRGHQLIKGQTVKRIQDLRQKTVCLDPSPTPVRPNLTAVI